MKTLVIALVVILASMNIFGQSINIHTKTGTDSYKLSQIDSSIVYNRQIFTSADTLGTFVLFKNNLNAKFNNLSFSKLYDKKLNLLIEELSEDYLLIKKLNYFVNISFSSQDSIFSDFLIGYDSKGLKYDTSKFDVIALALVLFEGGEEKIVSIIDLDFIQRLNDKLIFKFPNLSILRKDSINNLYEITFSFGLVPKNRSVIKLNTVKEDDDIQSKTSVGAPIDYNSKCCGGSNFKITYKYGRTIAYGKDFHGGIDIRTKDPSETKGYQKIISVEDGIVSKVTRGNITDNWGQYVTIKHNIDNQTYFTLYGHLSFIESYIEKSSLITKGTVIGLSGGYKSDWGHGRSTGSHLHFEVRKDEDKSGIKYYRNPEEIFSFESQSNSNDSYIYNQRWTLKNMPLNSSSKFGSYYLWSEAMNGSTKVGAQGICPNGYHIPSMSEWKLLKAYINKYPNNFFNNQYGGLMKNNNLLNENNYAYYWTSEKNGNVPYYIYISKSQPNGINISDGLLKDNNSISIYDKLCVRCIKDFNTISDCKNLEIQASTGVVAQQIELLGENFAPISTIEPIIYFNYEPLEPISYDNQKIVFEIPETSNYGNMISVKNSVGDESNSIYLRVDENETKPYPFVHFLTPSFTYEGESVTISGNSFGEYNASNSQLFLGDNRINVNPTDWTETSIKFTVPAEVSSNNIIVKVEGRSSKPAYFEVTEKLAPTPYIYYIEPQMALVGDTIEINGLNFGSTAGNNTITFNGTNATINTIAWSDKKIQLVVPIGATSGDVVVKVNQDLSNNMYFVVLAPAAKPVITSIVPTHFQVGENVTIKGNYFGYNPNGSDYVEMNAQKVDNSNITDWNNSLITLKVPQGVTSGKLFITANKLKSDGIDFAIDVPDTSSTGTVTDQNGNIYKTKIFGTQEWMIENLRIGQGISSETAQMNNSIVEKYAYNDVTSNDSLGGLYLWDEAMNWSTDPSGICPLGWHIPSDTEWNTLINFIGTNPGTKLMDGGISGFNAKITGSWFASFWGAKTETYFWTSTPTSISNAISRSLQIGSTSVGLNDDDKQNGYCIRCMKNK